MKKRSSAPARIFATLAVIGGFVLIFVVLSVALSDKNDDGGDTKQNGGQVTRQEPTPAKKTPATYEVKNGDTLTSIAQSTGVPVGQIERLNPGVDPQILNPGEELKLK
ncbi:MAG TPA: LysM domain-containing protein [Solirubrobacterales bacterium]